MNKALDRSLPQVNALIIDKLSDCREDVRELATQAVRLAGSHSESAIVEALLGCINKLAKQQPGIDQ